MVEPSERDNPAASDADLLRAFARSRDDLAFGRLVARHADVVRAVALRATGNAHAAEDVAQATFLVLSGRVGPAMRSAERRGGVRPWLAKTCRYCAANWRRSEQRRRRRERVAAVPEQVDTSQPGEMAEAVETAMSRLSSRDRRLIELHHLGDLPWPQVATELNLTPDAAKRAGARAMERLRESLRGRGVELGAAGVAATLAALSKPAAAAPPSPAAFSIAKGTLTMLKLKTAAVAAALILTAAGTAATAVQLADQQPPPPAPAVVPVVAAAPAAKPGPWAVKLPNGTGVELLAIRRVDPGDKVSAAWQPDGKPADWPAGAVVDRENPLYVTINPFGGGYFEFAVRYTDVDVPTTGHNNTRDDISAFPFLDVNLKNTRDALNPTMGMTADGVRVYAESPNGDANAVAALTFRLSTAVGPWTTNEVFTNEGGYDMSFLRSDLAASLHNRPLDAEVWPGALTELGNRVSASFAIGGTLRQLRSVAVLNDGRRLVSLFSQGSGGSSVRQVADGKMMDLKREASGFQLYQPFFWDNDHNDQKVGRADVARVELQSRGYDSAVFEKVSLVAGRSFKPAVSAEPAEPLAKPQGGGQ